MKEYDLCTVCCNWSLKIITDTTEVDYLLNRFFNGFFCDCSSLDIKENLEIKIVKTDTGFSLFGKGKEYRVKNEVSLCFYIYQIIDKLIEGNMNDNFIVFHGGAVSKKGKSYCIIAPTTVGKTTLITYLASNGFDYLADDYIFVEKVTGKIYPMPLPVSLRDITILNQCFKNRPFVSGYNELRGIEGTLVAFENPCDLQSFERVLFLHRDTREIVVEKNKGSLYKDLLFNMKKAINIDNDRIAIHKFINNIRGFDVYFHDLEHFKNVLLPQM